MPALNLLLPCVVWIVPASHISIAGQVGLVSGPGHGETSGGLSG
jgi:hypothetical protein